MSSLTCKHNVKYVDSNLPSNTVSQFLAWQNGYVFTYSFVGVEIQCQLSVIFLNDYTRRFLHGLSSDTGLKIIAQTYSSSFK